MPVDQAVVLGKATLQEVIILSGPILAFGIGITLLINIAQVLTSLQDPTLSSVPRLIASGAAVFFLMPWMWRQLAQFTIHLFSDFSAYVR